MKLTDMVKKPLQEEEELVMTDEGASQQLPVTQDSLEKESSPPTPPTPQEEEEEEEYEPSPVQ